VNSIIGELFSRDMQGLLEFTRMTCELIGNIRRLHKPVIASLNGTTAGAGAVLALAADLRIAADTAKIAFLFTKVGLAGSDMGAAYLLPRVIGLSKATELLYTGDFISAAEAERVGLYNRVVSSTDLKIETAKWAEKLASGPAFSIGMTKEMLNNELDMNFSSALEAEAQAQAICMMNPDYQEAYEAFVARRKPVFNKTEK
jgi:enoyl-CoA hydratase/carnithine racemase